MQNLVKGKNIVGLKVYTMQTGKYIAEISDIIYDPITQRVRAFILGHSGLFADTKFLLMEDVKTIGKDSVLVDNENLVKKSGGFYWT